MTKSTLINNLEKLTSYPAVSGNEGVLHGFLKELIGKIADKIYIDSVGNLIAIKGKPKTYIFAHVDKVGYMVSEKTNHSVKVVALKKKKNVQEKNWPVTIYGKESVFGLLSQEKSKDYLQIKLKKEELNKISIGDFIALAPNFCVKNNTVISQGLDNKLGILCAIEVFKKSKNIGLIFTVQEETTKLGAKYAALSLKPKAVIILDVTYDEGGYIKIGKGPSICMKDDLLPDKNLLKGLIDIAQQNKIPHQLEVIESGSSDANAIYDVNGFTPHIFVGIPIKFMHTPKEMGNVKDIENSVNLLIKFFE
jgi:endoglucanase